MIVDKLLSKAATQENMEKAKLIGVIHNNVSYSFWLATSLATSITIDTGFLLLGINFAINLIFCVKVIRLDKKICPAGPDSEQTEACKKQALTELLVNEIVEIIVPFAFIGSYLTAYYGPNASIMIDVGCKIWNHEPVEDLLGLILPVLEMAMMDSGSLILAGFILWYFCQLNILHEFHNTIRTYWMYLAMGGASFMSIVSWHIQYAINSFSIEILIYF